MQITLYNFTKKNNSTAVPSSGTASTGFYFKDVVNLRAPRLAFNFDDEPSYSYLKMKGKFYYINEWIYKKPFWVAVCTIDVLANNRNAINNVTAMVERARTVDDISKLNIDDGLIIPTADYDVIVTDFSTRKSDHYLNGTIIIQCISSLIQSENPGSLTSIAMSVAVYNEWVSKLSKTMSNFENAYVNPLTMVKNVRYYNIPVSEFSEHSVGINTVTVGNISIEVSKNVFYLQSNFKISTSANVTLSNHPQCDLGGRWINRVYRKLTLIAFPYGVVNIENVNSEIESLTINYDIDVFSGKAIFTVSKGADVFLTDMCDYAVSFPFSYTSFDVQSLLQGSASIVTSLLASIENPIGLLGLSSAISNINKGATPQIHSAGFLNSIIGLFVPEKIVIKNTILKFPDFENVGYLRYEILNIGDLSGFVKCSNAVFSASNAEDNRVVTTYLNGGFFNE